MSNHQRHSHEALCHKLLSEATDRLEQLRSTVERGDTDGRLDLERALDAARGLRNRALARVEAARQASDDAWTFACAQADQAIDELLQAINDLEHRLARAAA
ncbi:MAG TPA: hypothetical protein VD978_32765 [Azospirillum sp.]|nr:hypothetical protein [Azospirillum sp.]